MYMKQNQYKIMIAENPFNQSTNPEQFQHILKDIYDQMLTSEQRGDYVKADKLQTRAISERKRWQQFTTKEMDNRHINQTIQLQMDYNSKLQNCNDMFNKKMEDYVSNCKKYIKNTDENNKNEIKELKNDLNEQLPTKVKQTYQLLNLRQMEFHMSKQKNFPQAHLIQTKIKLVYEQELTAWNQERNKQINQAVCNLKARQNKERVLFNKRMQIQIEDISNDWHSQKVLLSQQFNSSLKEMKANHQRESLSFKRQFKTKGGCFSTKFQDNLV